MDALRCQFFGLTVEALLTRLRIAVIVVDQDAIVRWVNSAFCDMFATTASHVVDASVTRLLTPSSRAAFAAAFAGRKAGESTPYELATLRPDGTTLHVTVLPSPIYDDAGRFLGGFAVVNDRSRAQGERHRALVRTVQALATTIERRDAYTAGHQRQVANLSVEIGRRLQLDGERLEGLYLGALVHDVGKVAVPAELLTKPTALSEAERSIMRSHASIGQDILEGVALPWPIAAMVGQHHEHLDGSGYPLGLKGDEIIQEARIIAAADVLEAMSSTAPIAAPCSSRPRSASWQSDGVRSSTPSWLTPASRSRKSIRMMRLSYGRRSSATPSSRTWPPAAAPTRPTTTGTDAAPTPSSLAQVMRLWAGGE